MDSDIETNEDNQSSSGMVRFPNRASHKPMDLLQDTQNCGSRMHRKCRERFPHHRLRREPLVSDLGIHHARAVMHVGIANPRWRGKRSRHSRRMRSQQFYVSVKRPIECPLTELSRIKWQLELDRLPFDEQAFIPPDTPFGIGSL